MPEIGKAYVQIVPSAEGISGELENLLSIEAGSAGTAAGELFSANFGGALGGITEISSQVISSVVGAIGSITSELSSGISDVAAYGDNIDKLSQKMGISAEAYQEWDFIAQHSGTTMESIKGSFKTLSNAAQNNAEEFERLGISLDDVSSMSTEELFGAVIGGLQDMEAGTERTAVASKLLGKGATELGALLNTSAEDTENMKKRVHELGGVLSDEAVKDAAAYQDSLQDLTVSFDGLKNNLMAQFLPSIQGVMDGLTALITGDETGLEAINTGITEFITTMSENLPEVIPMVSSILLNIGDAIIQNLPIIIESGGQILMNLVTGIMEQLPLLLETGIQIINQLGSGIGSNMSELLTTASSIITELVTMLTDPDTLTSLLEAGLAILTGIADGIIESIPIFIEALPQVIDNIAEFLIESIPTLIETAVQLVVGIVEALPTIIESLVSALPSVIESITTTLVSLLPQLVEASIQLIQGIVENLPNIINALIGAIPTIIDAVVNALVELTPVIVTAGFDLFVALIENADEIITQILTLIPNIITSTVNAIEENWDSIAEAGFNLIVQLVTKTPDILAELENAVLDICDAVLGFFEDSLEAITDIGWNLIEGFINGAKDAWDFLKDGFLNIIDGAVDAAKDLLGIASPSKVFRKIGEFVVEGFDEGTEGLGDSAVEQTQQMIKDINSLMEENGINFDIESAMRYNGAYDGNVAFDSTNNYLYNLLATYLPQIASGRNMNISLEGGAAEIFKVVRTSNREYTDSTGYNPMVMG